MFIKCFLKFSAAKLGSGNGGVGWISDIGSNSLRTKNNLTLEELASRRELTKGFLSQLERNLTSPSIATPQGYRRGAGHDAGEVFPGEETEEKLVFTDDDYFVDEREDCTIHWIVPNAQKNEMEPILLGAAAAGQSHEVAVHEGEEFGYVLSGRIKLVNLDTGKAYSVKKADVLCQGLFSHCLKNDSARAGPRAGSAAADLLGQQRKGILQMKKPIQFKNIVRELDGPDRFKGA